MNSARPAPSGRCEVFLSPHYDDAVFSAGSRLARGGAGVRLITVCGGVPTMSAPSSWDRRCGFLDGAEAALVRRAEDDAVCLQLGVQRVRLPFLDQPYQPGKRVDALAASIAPYLCDAATIWAPTGIGGHPDHVVVRDAAIRCAGETGRLRLYADTPYAAAYGWDADDAVRGDAFGWAPKLAAVRALGIALSGSHVDKLTEEQTGAKIRLARSYASQLSGIGHRYPTLMHIDGCLGTEVWWEARPRATESGRP